MIKGKKIVLTVVIISLFIIAELLKILEPQILMAQRHNYFLIHTLSSLLYVFGLIALMVSEKAHMFGKPQKAIFILPALAVAITNFPFFAILNGETSLVHSGVLDFILFGSFCVSTALFEELLFRGVFFPIMIYYLPKSKKGLVVAIAISSAVFGLAHILNIFSMSTQATLMQIGYSFLTGALFCFTLVKTRNVLICAFAHALFNFGGLLFSSQGLGTGNVFNLPFILATAIVGITTTVIIIFSLIRYDDAERQTLYHYLGYGCEK